MLQLAEQPEMPLRVHARIRAHERPHGGHPVLETDIRQRHADVVGRTEIERHMAQRPLRPGIAEPDAETDVVLYEEGLDEETIRGAVEAIASADMLLIGGTSLVVYPAAGFIDYFRGSRLAVINKSETAKNIRSELTISAPIGEILSRIKV